MKPPKTFLFWMLFGLMLWIEPALASNPSKAFNFLMDVQMERQYSETLLVLEFEHPVHLKAPRYFRNSIEFDIEGASLSADKQYFPSQDEELRQIYASQISPTAIRMRLFPNISVAELKNRLQWIEEGRILKVRLEKSPTLESLLARAQRIQTRNMGSEPLKEKRRRTFSQSQKGSGKGEKPDPLEPKSEKATQDYSIPDLTRQKTRVESALSQKPVLLSEVVGKNLPPVPLKTTNEKPFLEGSAKLLTPVESASVIPDLWSSGLKMVYALALVLGVLFIMFHLFKKYFWKNGIFGSDTKPIKVLSTGFLGPKKSIALVEIPGEVLVLGIANENISLLGQIREPEAISQIKGELPKGGTQSGPQSQKPEGKPTVSGKKEIRLDHAKRTSNSFVDYVKRFSEKPEEPSLSVNDVTALIRKNLKKVQANES